MAAIITSKFRFHNAEQFKESFSEAVATNYYMFIGRPSIFASTTTGGTDSAPPTPVDNRRSEAYNWDDMLAAKKIDSTGVTHAIPRRDLDISGATTYDMYRPNYSSSNPAYSGATNLFDSTFYFMTSAYRVYKVLENNGNSAWTAAEPTDDSQAPFASGGYTLKYMFTLTTSQVQNFLTPDFIPVLITPEANKALSDGMLHIIKIILSGTALVGGVEWNVSGTRTITNVPIRGDGTGGLCTVSIGSGGSVNGQITAITITSNGANYTQAAVLLADIIEQHLIQHATVLSFSVSPTFELIIGPDGGHGSNPAKELGGHFALMDVKLQQTEAYDFSVVNDFRQLGIVRNPYSYGTTSNFTSSTARQTSAIKLASNSGTFTVDEKISQTIAAAAVGSLSISGSIITINTSAAHKLGTGQMVDITGGSWSGTGISNATGHQGTHHITVTDSDTFTITVSSSRTPTITEGSITAPTNTEVTYTTFQPQGIVVEFDATNKVLFYVQNAYDNQGTDATWKQKIPFSGNSTITGATSSATGVPDTADSGTYNNTVFVAGYTNPELQPDSGDIIYIENRKPISRASDQTEDVKLVVEF